MTNSITEQVAKLIVSGEQQGYVNWPAILRMECEFYREQARQEYELHLRRLVERT